MIPLDSILENAKESRVTGSRSVVAWGWWWMKGSSAKGTRKALGVMEMFCILIVDGDFMGVCICQNSSHCTL